MLTDRRRSTGRPAPAATGKRKQVHAHTGGAAKITVSCENDCNAFPVDGELADISQAGIRLLLAEPPHADVLQVEVRDLDDAIYHLEAQVLWSEETSDHWYDVGCELLADLPTDQCRRLQHVATATSDSHQ